MSSPGRLLGTVQLAMRTLPAPARAESSAWEAAPKRPAGESLGDFEATQRREREGRWMVQAHAWVTAHVSSLRDRIPAHVTAGRIAGGNSQVPFGQRLGIRFVLSVVTPAGSIDEQHIGYAASDGATLYVVTAAFATRPIEGAFTDVAAWDELVPHLDQLVDGVRLSPLPTDAYPRAELEVRDQVGRADDFYPFRDKLRQAVRQRNAAVFRANTTFGEGQWYMTGTLDDFAVDDPRSAFWDDMGKALSIGCAQASDTWVCPNVAAVWDMNVRSPFDFVAVVGSGVEVRSEPKPDAPVLTTLSNEMVRATEGLRDRLPGEPPWTNIIVPDGRQGYVPDAVAYSPVGFRAGFERVKGRWQLTWFVAGD